MKTYSVVFSLYYDSEQTNIEYVIQSPTKEEIEENVMKILKSYSNNILIIKELMTKIKEKIYDSELNFPIITKIYY